MMTTMIGRNEVSLDEIVAFGYVIIENNCVI
jgi:hypothetical protein